MVWAPHGPSPIIRHAGVAHPASGPRRRARRRFRRGRPDVTLSGPSGDDAPPGSVIEKLIQLQGAEDFLEIGGEVAHQQTAAVLGQVLVELHQ